MNPEKVRVKPYFSRSVLVKAESAEVTYMGGEHPRMKREKKTIEEMVKYYCKKKHGTHGQLCPECTEFLTYAKLRLDKCPFQEKKSTCGKCIVHCYRPDMKEKAKTVMRYSGPRMIVHHPVLALHHVWDGRREPPKLEKKTAGSAT